MYLLPINGVIGEDFKLTDLLMHLNAAKNESVIKLIINSPGGYVDVADAIVETLNKSGKLIYSTNSGDVASAAVEIFLTAQTKEQRTFDPAKGAFLIHMPFLDPKDGGATGTAEDIQAVADEMKKLNKKIVTSYTKCTGTDATVIEAFMKENIPLTPEQIDMLGFATVSQSQQLKAVAYFNFNNSNNMTNEEVVKKLGIIENLLNKAVAFFPGLKPKNLMLQDTNGVELDFGNDIQEASQIVPGIKVMAGGKPAEGEYILPTGETLVCVGGELKEVKPAEGDAMEALKTEIANLKAELETKNQALDAKNQEFETFKASAQNQITEISNQFKAFKMQFSTGDEPTFSTTPKETAKTASGISKADFEKMLTVKI